MSFEGSQPLEIQWKQLGPTRRDCSQRIIFGVHLIIAIFYSYYQFTNSPGIFFSGESILVSILIATTGFMFYAIPGITWYREEMVPYMAERFTMPEFQTDDFLRLKRIESLAVLPTGYISILMCRYLWSLFSPWLMSLSVDSATLLQMIVIAQAGITIVYVMFQIVLLFLFGRFLNHRYQGIQNLIRFESDWRNAMHELEKLKTKESKAHIKDDDSQSHITP